MQNSNNGNAKIVTATKLISKTVCKVFETVAVY